MKRNLNQIDQYLIEGSDIEKIKIRVRAYKKVNGISVYGSWSNTRSKKCW